MGHDPVQIVAVKRTGNETVATVCHRFTIFPGKNKFIPASPAFFQLFPDQFHGYRRFIFPEESGSLHHFFHPLRITGHRSRTEYQIDCVHTVRSFRILRIIFL